jgi:hypothetical protein
MSSKPTAEDRVIGLLGQLVTWAILFGITGLALAFFAWSWGLFFRVVG